jgi:UDP-GlcNAc3NAcA epimerase
MKVVSVVGARPQFIKAGAVSRLLRKQPEIREVLVHTGQHYDANMSQIFFRDLAIPEPDHNLGIGSHSHGVQTGRMLAAIEDVLLQERPDRVLVYGDTNSTLAGALAAVKLQIPVAHVEAGLRSYDRRMPEEINRVLTDHVSDLLFAPTEGAAANLRREGIQGDSVHLVGDVMYDAALFHIETSSQRDSPVARFGLSPGDYILATIHRAENTDDEGRLGGIFKAFAAVAAEVRILVPLHPRTRAALERSGSLADGPPGLLLVEPLGYLDMIRLEKDARLIVTDSGGVQKEAFFFRVPCLTLRDRTEWTELVELGWNRLVPPDGAGQIADALRAALIDEAPVGRKDRAADPYGGGRAAERIVNILSGSRA